MDRATIYQLVHSFRLQGMKQSKIAELLSIKQPRVSQILQQSVDVLPQWGGHKPSKLTPDQKESLLIYLEKGASHFGFEGDFWDSKRVKQLILEQFSVEYHIDYMPDLLKDLGYSQQVPQVKDYRQDPQKIETFLQETLPTLKKSSGRK